MMDESMRKVLWLLPGLLTLALLGGRTPASAQPTEVHARPAALSHTDGSTRAVMQAGAHRILAVVGQPVAAGLASRRGSIWHLRRALAGPPAAGALMGAGDVPAVFALEHNYPNPFNPETTIRFALPEAAHVAIDVYDVLGRHVERLADREFGAGFHTVRFEAGGLASGLYIYRMRAGAFDQHRIMTLVR